MSSSIEIECEQLSEEVRESLLDELDDPELANQKANEIKLNNMNNANARRGSTTRKISNKLKEFIGKFKLIKSYEESSQKRKIINIKPKNNAVIFETEEDFNRNLVLEKNSKALANLVEYKNVDNVIDLKNENIQYIEFGTHEKYILPYELSLIHKFKYKCHNILLNYTQFMKNMNMDLFYRLYLGLVCTWWVVLLGLDPSETFGYLSAIVLIIFGLLIVSHHFTEILKNKINYLNFYRR